MELSLGDSLEADFVIWYQRQRQMQRNDDTDVIFGEAKSFGEHAFKKIDTDRLKRIGERFPGCYIVLACLKRAFGDEEKEIIEDLVAWGKELDERRNPRARVIVLTGNELFFEWSLTSSWDKDERYKALTGGRYINLTSLENVAKMTQDLYASPSTNAPVIGNP
jgi:hypothetical protein